MCLIDENGHATSAAYPKDAPIACSERIVHSQHGVHDVQGDKTLSKHVLLAMNSEIEKFFSNYKGSCTFVVGEDDSILFGSNLPEPVVLSLFRLVTKSLEERASIDLDAGKDQEPFNDDDDFNPEVN